jgi:energy-coupling factor transport system substrate-specific component
MSWELASFLVVGAILLAGFAWYERSRPPAQVVALVAALAALAIAGRIAFAAFPNVKPTTDIVIFAGFALGGAPGFAVGALAALVSNFYFGQGPWTPWQMVAWGICGLLGAALARIGPNPNRFVLAAVCGFSGAIFGALMNFQVMATAGGELSLARYLVLEGQAIPFDAAHVVANVAFALVAGPAMLRMLVRFRERFEWKRRDRSESGGPDTGAPVGPGGRLGPALRGGGVAALVLAVLALAALAPPARADSAGAVGWMKGVQNEDGGWGSSAGDSSDPTMTCWSMLGLESAGTNPLDVAAPGGTPVDYLRAMAGSLKSSGSLSLAILALDGAGIDPRHFSGRNLVSALIGLQHKDGSYEEWPGRTSYAILALRSAGAGGAANGAANWLRRVQNADGGWGDTVDSPSTADGTGAAMMALSGSKAAQRGIAYLKDHQRQSGGFSIGAGGTVNTMSTAWAVQGILAGGGNPAAVKRGGNSALDYLAANQARDGSYRYAAPGGGTSKLVAEQTPVWTTAIVLAGATETTYPIASVARAPKPPASSTDRRSPPSGGEGAGSAPPSSFSPEAEPQLGGISPEALPESGGEPSSTSPPPRKHRGGKKGGGKKSKPPGGAKAGTGAPPGTKVAPPGTEPAPTGREPATETASESEDGDDSSSVAGAILAGVLAGCLLFGAAWLGRRGWMRWRYGL